jgi:RHS repeat-associated protein
VTYALHTDRLGSVTTVSDGLDASFRKFAAFGDFDAGEFGPASVAPGFTGHRHDAEPGLIDMKGRMYDPSAGRFLSADPIMDPSTSQSIHPYSYVGE